MSPGACSARCSTCLLRLLHPLIPFVTDALWTQLTGGESVVIAPWPAPDKTRIDPAAEADSMAVQAAITDGSASPVGQRREAHAAGAGQGGRFRRGARVAHPIGGATGPVWLTASLNTHSLTPVGGSIELDFSTGIDVAATRARLTKELEAAEKERSQNTAKLANSAFTDKAPEPVIAKVRARVVAAEADIARIEAALAALGGN